MRLSSASMEDSVGKRDGIFWWEKVARMERWQLRSVEENFTSIRIVRALDSPACASANARPSFKKLTHTMRFGLNTFLYASPFTNESVKLFPKLKKWGFETVEIPVEALEHIDPAKVKAAADKAGLKIGSICACMGPGRDLRGAASEQKTAAI